MRALIAFRETGTDNIFVYALRDAIAAQGIEVICSLDRFWTDETFYDIVHIQWPEELTGWYDPSAENVERLETRLGVLKQRGSRIVYTRHNTAPHYGDPVTADAYRVVAEACDLVVHMGRYSCDEFCRSYPDYKGLHAVIPHHIYQGYYDTGVSREQARRELGIPADRFVITAFGKFRSNDEVKKTLSVFRQFRCRKKYLLAPRLLPFSPQPPNPDRLKRIISRLAYRIAVPLLRLRHVDAGAQNVILEDSRLPYYLAASDVVFIQRMKILNSGNVPLAFLFGRAVVGPARGNVQEILEQTGNPLFDPDDLPGVARAFEYAREHPGLGEANRRYAEANWSLERVGALYAGAYRSVLKS